MSYLLTLSLLLAQAGEPPDPLGGGAKPAAPNAADDLLNDPKPAATPGTAEGGVPGKPQDFKPQGVTPAEAAPAAAGEPKPESAAETADDAPPVVEAKPFWERLKEMSGTGVMGLMVRGGIFMWPILLLGIIAFGVIIERYRSLKMLTSDSYAVRSQVRDLLQSDRIEEALELCDREQGPVPAILGTGVRKLLVLKRLNYDAAKIDEQVIKAMDDYGVHIVAALERHLPILATVSSAAPMLGFLGTVSGMITSFDDIVASLGQKNIVEAAAAGIAEALITTMAGLVVGIPAYVAFNYFTSVTNRFVLDVEESATELMEVVTLKMALEQKDEHPEGMPVEA